MIRCSNLQVVLTLAAEFTVETEAIFPLALDIGGNDITESDGRGVDGGDDMII